MTLKAFHPLRAFNCEMSLAEAQTEGRAKTLAIPIPIAAAIKPDRWVAMVLGRGTIEMFHSSPMQPNSRLAIPQQNAEILIKSNNRHVVLPHSRLSMQRHAAWFDKRHVPPPRTQVFHRILTEPREPRRFGPDSS
jgi:hypothetical protein